MSDTPIEFKPLDRKLQGTDHKFSEHFVPGYSEQCALCGLRRHNPRHVDSAPSYMPALSKKDAILKAVFTELEP